MRGEFLENYPNTHLREPTKRIEVYQMMLESRVLEVQSDYDVRWWVKREMRGVPR